MRNITEGAPPGVGFTFKKILVAIICRALKTETFYNIVSRCLEKQGKKIMSEVDIKKNFETLIKENRENREKLERENRELKRDNQELKEKLERETRELKEMIKELLKRTANGT